MLVVFKMADSGVLYLVQFSCLNLQRFAEGSLPSALLAKLSQLDRSRCSADKTLSIELTFLEKRKAGNFTNCKLLYLPNGELFSHGFDENVFYRCQPQTIRRKRYAVRL